MKEYDRFLNDYQNEYKKNISVDKDGFTLLPNDIKYFIEWYRIDTKDKLLSWIQHLSEKIWLTSDVLRYLLDAVCEKFSWNFHMSV